MPVKSPAIDRVEDLRKDKSVEDEGLDNGVLFRIDQRVVRVGITEDPEAEEMEDESDDDLISRLEQYLLVHVDGKQRSRFLVGFTVQEGLRGRIRGQRQCCKSVHDDIDPKKLYSRKNRCF